MSEKELTEIIKNISLKEGPKYFGVMKDPAIPKDLNHENFMDKAYKAITEESDSVRKVVGTWQNMSVLGNCWKLCVPPHLRQTKKVKRL